MTLRSLLGLVSTSVLLLSAPGCNPDSNTNNPAPSPDGGGSGPDAGTNPDVIYHPPVVPTSTCAARNVFLPPSFRGATKDVDANAFAADFNNDGLTDILQGHSGATDFNVTLNKGNGTFATTLSVTGPGNTGNALTAGDVNGDGYPDVLYVSPLDAGHTGVGVAVGNGDGTFKATKVYPLPGYQNSQRYLAVDLNNDKRDDLVIAALNAQNGLSTVVLVNNGDGTFGAPKEYDLPVGSTHHVFQAADFNGDGKMDIAVYNDLGDNSGKGICVALGNGDGTLGAKSCYTGPSGRQLEAVMAGDLNGDGKVDLVTAQNANGRTGASVYMNKGNGTFEDGVAVDSDPNIFDGQLLDMNNDGKLDLLLLTTWGYVESHFGLGDGTFDPTPTLFAVGEPVKSTNTPVPMLAGDFLGQGLKGVALTRLGTDDFEVVNGTCRTGVLPNPAPLVPGGAARSTCAPAKVTAGATRSLTASGSSDGVVAVDLNNDNKTDLVHLGGPSGSSFQYFLSNGDGSFGAAKGGGDGSASGGGIAAGDLNGDGFADIVYSTGGSGSSQLAAVVLNNGKGSFGAPKSYALSNETSFGASAFSSFLLADINNDGKLDLLADGLAVLGRGDGSFAAAGYPVPLYFSRNVAPYRAVDVNGDKQLDIISVSPGSASNTGGTPTGFCVSLNLGNSQFAPPACTAYSANPMGVDVGDVNGDGKPDVVLTNASIKNTGLGVFLGKGDGTFGELQSFATPDTNTASVSLADVNNDGHLDAIVWSGLGSGLVSTLLGKGDGTFAAGTSVTAGNGNTGHVQVLVGDFAGNGLRGYAVFNSSRPGFDVETTTCSP
jgi:hypothetical protein